MTDRNILWRIANSTNLRARQQSNQQNNSTINDAELKRMHYFQQAQATGQRAQFYNQYVLPSQGGQPRNYDFQIAAMEFKIEQEHVNSENQMLAPQQMKENIETKMEISTKNDIIEKMNKLISSLSTLLNEPNIATAKIYTIFKEYNNFSQYYNNYVNEIANDVQFRNQFINKIVELESVFKKLSDEVSAFITSGHTTPNLKIVSLDQVEKILQDILKTLELMLDVKPTTPFVNSTSNLSYGQVRTSNRQTLVPTTGPVIPMPPAVNGATEIDALDEFGNSVPDVGHEADDAVDVENGVDEDFSDGSEDAKKRGFEGYYKDYKEGAISDADLHTIEEHSGLSNEIMDEIKEEIDSDYRFKESEAEAHNEHMRDAVQSLVYFYRTNGKEKASDEAMRELLSNSDEDKFTEDEMTDIIAKTHAYLDENGHKFHKYDEFGTPIKQSKENEGKNDTEIFVEAYTSYLSGTMLEEDLTHIEQALSLSAADIEKLKKKINSKIRRKVLTVDAAIDIMINLSRTTKGELTSKGMRELLAQKDKYSFSEEDIATIIEKTQEYIAKFGLEKPTIDVDGTPHKTPAKPSKPPPLPSGATLSVVIDDYKLAFTAYCEDVIAHNGIKVAQSDEATLHGLVGAFDEHQIVVSEANNILINTVFPAMDEIMKRTKAPITDIDRTTRTNIVVGDFMTLYKKNIADETKPMDISKLQEELQLFLGKKAVQKLIKKAKLDMESIKASGVPYSGSTVKKRDLDPENTGDQKMDAVHVLTIIMENYFKELKTSPPKDKKVSDKRYRKLQDTAETLGVEEDHFNAIYEMVKKNLDDKLHKEGTVVPLDSTGSMPNIFNPVGLVGGTTVYLKYLTTMNQVMKPWARSIVSIPNLATVLSESKWVELYNRLSGSLPKKDRPIVQAILKEHPEITEHVSKALNIYEKFPKFIRKVNTDVGIK